MFRDPGAGDFGPHLVARGEGWSVTLDERTDPPRLVLDLKDPEMELLIEDKKGAAGVQRTNLTVRLPADFATELLKNKRALRGTPREEG